jgi:membrane associated rhomboid family serine protease
MLLLMVPSQIFTLAGIVLYFMLMTNRQAVPIPPVYVRALVMVGLLGVMSLLLGIFSRGDVAHFAHLGGMLGGWLTLVFWRRSGRLGRRR